MEQKKGDMHKAEYEKNKIVTREARPTVVYEDVRATSSPLVSLYASSLDVVHAGQVHRNEVEFVRRRWELLLLDAWKKRIEL